LGKAHKLPKILGLSTFALMHIEQIAAKIAEVIGHFKDDSDYYLRNEMSTRDQLINPILNVLGWQTANPKLVRPNQKNEQGDVPDYTLLKNSQKVLVIEAKKASVDVQDKKVMDQLVKYCYGMGIKFGLITNGLQWLLFDTFERNPAERIVWVADLTRTQDRYSTQAKILSQFTFQNIDTLADRIKQGKVLEEYWANNFGSFAQIVKFIGREIKEGTKRDQNISLTAIEEFVGQKLVAWVSAPSQAVVASPVPKANPLPVTDNPTDPNPERAQKSNIKVTFTDGKVVFNKRASDTFTQVIERIGGERVQALNLRRNGVNLVEPSNSGKYSQYPIKGGLFVMVHSSTSEKVKLLTEISNRLGLNLKIEME
jgi:predicted type IV restriction endonuclease